MASKFVTLRKAKATEWLGNGCGTAPAQWQAICRKTGDVLGSVAKAGDRWLFRQHKSDEVFYRDARRSELVRQVEKYAAQLLKYTDTHDVETCHSCGQAFCTYCSNASCEKCIAAACYHCNTCPDCENTKWVSGGKHDRGVFYSDPEFMNCDMHGAFCESAPCCEYAAELAGHVEL